MFCKQRHRCSYFFQDVQDRDDGDEPEEQEPEGDEDEDEAGNDERNWER